MSRPRDAGGRIVLTDRPLTHLARRDRTSVGVAKRRWSVALEDAETPLEWRNLSGRRTRQLLRNVEHTSAVHGFLAALAVQAPLLGWEIAQLDPPRRASRHFRHDGGMRAVNPDAFGVLTRRDTRWPFFLEWERRGRAALNHVRPTRPLSALLLIAQAHRRPRRPTRRPGRLRRRHRGNPLPAPGPAAAMNDWKRKAMSSENIHKKQGHRRRE